MWIYTCVKWKQDICRCGFQHVEQFSVLIKEHTVFCIWPCLLNDNHYNAMQDHCQLVIFPIWPCLVLLSYCSHSSTCLCSGGWYSTTICPSECWRSARVILWVNFCHQHIQVLSKQQRATPPLPFTADLIIHKLWRFSVNINIAVMGKCKGDEVWLWPFVNRTSGT